MKSRNKIPIRFFGINKNRYGGGTYYQIKSNQKNYNYHMGFWKGFTRYFAVNKKTGTTYFSNFDGSFFKKT